MKNVIQDIVTTYRQHKPVDDDFRDNITVNQLGTYDKTFVEQTQLTVASDETDENDSSAVDGYFFIQINLPGKWCLL